MKRRAFLVGVGAAAIAAPALALRNAEEWGKTHFKEADADLTWVKGKKYRWVLDKHTEEMRRQGWWYAGSFINPKNPRIPGILVLMYK